MVVMIVMGGAIAGWKLLSSPPMEPVAKAGCVKGVLWKNTPHPIAPSKEQTKVKLQLLL